MAETAAGTLAEARVPTSSAMRAVGFERVLFPIDRLSAWVGKTFAWTIAVLTVFMTYDITMRYLSQAPGIGVFVREVLWFTRAWSYDISYELYATLFMMGGAYTLSRAAHVRGDVIYRLFPIRVQGGLDLVLYLVAFFPATIALVSVGWQWAQLSYSFLEKSPTQPAGPPIWPLKFVIPFAATFLVIQGVAETIRAFQALTTGTWPRRLADVEETETILARQSEV